MTGKLNKHEEESFKRKRGAESRDCFASDSRCATESRTERRTRRKSEESANCDTSDQSDAELCEKLGQILVEDCNNHNNCQQKDANNETCSQAAREEVSVDELAAYFDVSVHIPKKMSFMAELMYT